MTFAALQPLADRAALIAALRQETRAHHAVDALGEYRWDADMAAGTLTFSSTTDPSHNLVTRPHLIATIAPGPRSLLWAWAHPQGDRKGVPGRAAARLRRPYDMPELTQSELPFPDDIGSDIEAWIADTAHQIGTIAVEITGRSPGIIRSHRRRKRAPCSCSTRRSRRRRSPRW